MKKKANGKEKTEEKKDTPVANPFFQKDFVSWAGAGFITKILGYLRDALLVAAFGGSALTDAYYAAFRIINLFRRTIGEGGLNAVFIPGYAVERNKGGANAEEFSARFWTATLAGSMIIAAAGILLCRPLTFLTAAGFLSSPDYFTFTALLTAVFAPHFLFVNVSAYFTALLNSSGRFFLPEEQHKHPGIFRNKITSSVCFFCCQREGICDTMLYSGILDFILFHLSNLFTSYQPSGGISA